MKDFQQWCIDTLVHIGNSLGDYRASLEDQGYKYTIKSIISHYASMYRVKNKVISLPHGKCHINLWWDHLKEENFHKFFSPLLISQAANKILDSGYHKKMNEQLRIEHITPNGYIYKKLKGLLQSKRQLKRSEVAVLFRQSKLVVLAKREESDAYLDGKGAHFENEDVRLLRRFYPKESDMIQEAETLVRDEKSPKSNGSGLLRLMHLWAKGVRFELGGNRVAVGDLKQYLEYGKYVIE